MRLLFEHSLGWQWERMGAMRRKTWMVKLAAGMASLLLLTGLCACSHTNQEESSSQASQVEDLSLFPEGASIGGKNIAGKTVEEALEIARNAMQEQVGSLEITVKFRDDTILLSGEDFVTQDVLDLTLPRMLEERCSEDIPLNYVTDLSEAGEQKLLTAAQSCVTEAKEATISGRGEDGSFTFSDEQTGSRVDLSKTLESVRQLLSQKHGGDIQAAFVETAPKQTKAYLQEHFVKLSSYSTVSTNTANGNSNMKLALSKVNGTILQPGEEFPTTPPWGTAQTPTTDGFPPEVFPAASSCRCTAAVFARVPQPCTLPPSTPAWRLWSAGNTPSPPPIAPLVWTPLWTTGTWTSALKTPWKPRCTSPPGWTAPPCTWNFTAASQKNGIKWWFPRNRPGPLRPCLR